MGSVSWGKDVDLLMDSRIYGKMMM